MLLQQEKIGLSLNRGEKCEEGKQRLKGNKIRENQAVGDNVKVVRTDERGK